MRDQVIIIYYFPPQIVLFCAMEMTLVKFGTRTIMQAFSTAKLYSHCGSPCSCAAHLYDLIF